MWLADCRILDVRTGEEVRADAIEVRDGRITQLSSDGPRSVRSEEVRLLGGSYVMPGLISCHTHLSITHPLGETDEDESPLLTAFRAAQRAQAALRAGVTTVRCVHEQYAADLWLRMASKKGWFEAPTIFGAGRAISKPDGHGAGQGCQYAEGEVEFYDAAARELEAGADHLKIFISGGLMRGTEDMEAVDMTLGEMSAVVRAAKERERYVVAHAANSASIERALEAGVRSFEHAYELSDAAARRMAELGVYLTPTLCVTQCPEYAIEHDLFTRDHSKSDPATETAARLAPHHMSSIASAVRAGVKLVNGTDFPPGDLVGGCPVVVREVELMIEAGLTPLGALQAATINAAELCNAVGSIGEVKVGMQADLIAVGEDPLANPRTLASPSLVMSRGRIAVGPNE